MSYIPPALREKIKLAAGNRCGYCLAHQDYVLGPLEIEHIVPVAKGGTEAESNLWLSYRLCNSHKGTQTQAIDPETNSHVPLFNPRTQTWAKHFTWNVEGVHIVGLTPCGHATVEALHLNHPIAVHVRQYWVQAGWHPPQ